MDSVITKMLTGISPKKTENKRPYDFGVRSPSKRPLLVLTENRPFRVSIEGNIGAGKSTLLSYFQKFPEIETYPEPIDCWRNLNGHNLLDLLYSDIQKWHTVFQTYVQLTRLKVQTTPPLRSTTTVQLFERSVQNNRYCFVEQARKSGRLHDVEYSILDSWFQWIKTHIDITIDLIVYLRTTPEVVHRRMLDRGRPEEQNIPLEYLQQLHEGHERWLMSGDKTINNTQVLVLDADKPLEEIVEEYKTNKHKIMGKHPVLCLNEEIGVKN